MTISQRNSIASPATGLMIYQIDSLNGFYYFTGSAWTPLKNTITNGNFTHAVGEIFGGGIIIYLWKQAGIEKGLIASLTDIGDSSVWSNVNNALIGTSAQSPNDGLANTNSIISQTGHVTSAALVCKNYNAGGFTDWYLPAFWELQHCFDAAFVVNTILGATDGFKLATYWSSTEVGSGFSYTQYLDYGNPNDGGKYHKYRVRAIRRF